jgi:hypothetical protein
MDENRMKTLAEMLLPAERSREPFPPLTESDRGITVDEAYRVQLHIMEKKKSGDMNDFGERPCRKDKENYWARVNSHPWERPPRPSGRQYALGIHGDHDRRRGESHIGSPSAAAATDSLRSLHSLTLFQIPLACR